jgi:hypothetical protein
VSVDTLAKGVNDNKTIPSHSYQVRYLGLLEYRRIHIFL